MKQPHDPFKASKREWKRIDPDGNQPGDEDDRCHKCSFKEWEIVPWAVVLFVAVLVFSAYLGNH